MRASDGVFYVMALARDFASGKIPKNLPIDWKVFRIRSRLHIFISEEVVFVLFSN